MRTVINYFDGDVITDYGTPAYRTPKLLESTYIADAAYGLSLMTAISKLPKAMKCRYTVERVPVQVERTNLMSGKTYLEEEDTEGFLSPSRESYWSM